MTQSAPSPIAAAVVALDEAEDGLVGLPANGEVGDLQRRWYALRTVVHGVYVRGVPTLTTAQTSSLVDRALGLAREIAEVRRRLFP